jgi:hypothetical protein
MLQVDDLIEPRAEQILLSRLPPFPWSHLVPRQNILRRVNHKSNLQGIPFRIPNSRQTRLPQPAVSRFQINDLGILHGRPFNLTKRFKGKTPCAEQTGFFTPENRRHSIWQIGAT